MTDDFDRFGPPRLGELASPQAYESELQRIDRLRVEGFVQRHEGEAFWWTPGHAAGRLCWHWVTRDGVSRGGTWPHLEDARRAWAVAVQPLPNAHELADSLEDFAEILESQAAKLRVQAETLRIEIPNCSGPGRPALKVVRT